MLESVAIAVTWTTVSSAHLPNSAEHMSVVTVEAHRDMYVLTSALCLSTASAAPRALKLGQNTHSTRVPRKENRSDVRRGCWLALLAPKSRRRWQKLALRPKYAPNVWINMVPPKGYRGEGLYLNHLAAITPRVASVPVPWEASWA